MTPPQPRGRIVLAVTSAQSLKLMRGFPEYLSASGWEVHVVTSDPPHSWFAAESGVVVHGLRMAREPSLWADLVSLWRWTRLLGELRPEVVMAGTPKAALLGTLAAALRGVPRRIYLLRGLRLETTIGARSRVLWFMEWLTALCSHQVIAVSPSLRAEFVRRRLCAPTKVLVLGSGSSNGVDIDRSVPDESVRRMRADLGLGEAMIVGYVGRIAADKGIATLLSAVGEVAARGTSVRLLLVGDEEPPGTFDTALARSGVDPDLVHRVGPVPDPTVYYRLMDVLCLPSLREGFPNVVLEAAVQSTPAVVSTATGSVDSVVDGVTGLHFPPRDVEALAEALMALHSDPEARVRLGRDARRRAVHEFERSHVWCATEGALSTSPATRVVYAGPFDFPRRNAAAQLAAATSAALAHGGLDVTVVGRSTAIDSVSSAMVLGDGVVATLAGRSGRAHALRQSVGTYRAVRSELVKGRVRALLVYNAPSSTLVSLMWLGHRFDVPVIAHATEWYAAPPFLARPVHSVAKRMDTALRMRVLHPRAAGLLVSSTYLAQFYAGRPTLVVPTLSLPPRSVPSRVPDDVPVMVYAGIPFERGLPNLRTSQMKDRLDRAIEWLAELSSTGRSFVLEVYGLEREEYLTAVPGHRDLVAHLGDALTFHGLVTQERVASAVVDADYTLLVRDPSRVSLAGFPTKVTESLMLGTPPIVSAVGDVARYVTTGVDGFLLPEQSEDAKRVLDTALGLDAPARTRMKEACAASHVLAPEQWTDRLVEFVGARFAERGC